MAASRHSKPTSFTTICLQCGLPLQIIDDLPETIDVAQSFRLSINESFVVIPTSDPDDFVAQHNNNKPSSADARPDGHQPHVAPLEEVLRVEKIIALASGQAQQDQPVCRDCLRDYRDEVQRQVDQADEDQQLYREAQARLEADLKKVTPQDAAALEAEIEAMEEEERQLLQVLASCEQEEKALDEEIERHRLQKEQLRREEDEFWLQVAEYQLDLEESEEERATTASAVQYATSELQRLKRTNVLNDMFHIADEGPFGTINKFRLGRLPDENVRWEEINAAWGQVCLLLDALMKKCGLQSSQYKLYPRGSYSAIQAAGETLDLYSAEGGLARYFSNRRFDLAMSAFLGCIKEVTKFLQRDRDSTMRVPFMIDGEKVGNFSVRMQFNTDERWTKALKYMLTDLKWMIALVESREFGERASAYGRPG